MIVLNRILLFDNAAKYLTRWWRAILRVQKKAYEENMRTRCWYEVWDTPFSSIDWTKFAQMRS
jgi:hypothetical protein